MALYNLIVLMRC